MIKEELKKEAEESAKKFFGKPTDLVDLDNLRIFKNGYFAGAEPREKQIAELEDKLANADYQLEGRDNEIAKLEKENAELKRINDNLEKDRLAHIELEDRLKKDNAELKEINTHTLSQLNLDNGELIIENEKLKKENAELKADNDARKFAMAMSEKVEKKLRQENKKAKEIIKKIEKIFYNGEEALKRLSKISDIIEEAEQFLKEEVNGNYKG